MCFERGSSPPILAGDRPIATSGPLVLKSSDGTRFAKRCSALMRNARETSVKALRASRSDQTVWHLFRTTRHWRAF